MTIHYLALILAQPLGERLQNCLSSLAAIGCLELRLHVEDETVKAVKDCLFGSSELSLCISTKASLVAKDKEIILC